MYSPSVRPASMRIAFPEMGFANWEEIPLTSARWSLFGDLLARTSSHLRHRAGSGLVWSRGGETTEAGPAGSSSVTTRDGLVINFGAYWPFGIVIRIPRSTLSLW